MTYRSTLAGLCLAALIAGCGGSSGDDGGSADKASPATKSQQKEHRGGTLTMLWNGAGTSIDTTLDYDQNWQVLTMTSDGLLNYRRVAGAKGSELVPDLAEEIPTASDDGKNYVFKSARASSTRPAARSSRATSPTRSSASSRPPRRRRTSTRGSSAATPARRSRSSASSPRAWWPTTPPRRSRSISRSPTPTSSRSSRSPSPTS